MNKPFSRSRHRLIYDSRYFDVPFFIAPLCVHFLLCSTLCSSILIIIIIINHVHIAIGTHIILTAILHIILLLLCTIRTTFYVVFV